MGLPDINTRVAANTGINCVYTCRACVVRAARSTQQKQDYAT